MVFHSFQNNYGGDSQILFKPVFFFGSPSRRDSGCDTMFSTITLLRLSNLPNLRCIYPEMDMLKELHVDHCQKLKFFVTEYQNSADLSQDDQDRFSTSQQAVVSLEKVWLFKKTMPKTHCILCLHIHILLGIQYILCVTVFVMEYRENRD